MANAKRFFSIIIPLYNKEACLEQTINHVLNQTYPLYEVIIVNDGSTDNSLDLARALAAKDTRIVVYSQPNGGVSAARNYGIGKARYPFIAFLDADDLWEENYLEEMDALIGRYPGCGMYGCAYKKVRYNKVTDYCRHVPEGVVEDYFQTMITDLIAWTSALVVKKDVFAKVGLFPVGMIRGEDYYMWTKVAVHYKMAFTPKVLAAYNIYLGSISARIGKKDCSTESWFSFYKSNDFFRNEFIANKAIDNGIRHAWGNHKQHSRTIEQQFRYTQLFKGKWYKLLLLNRLPTPLLLVLLFFKKRLDPLYAYSMNADKLLNRSIREPEEVHAFRPHTIVRMVGPRLRWARTARP